MPKMHIAWIPIRNLPSHGVFFCFFGLLPDFIFSFGHNLRDHGASIARNYRRACAVCVHVAVAVAMLVAVAVVAVAIAVAVAAWFLIVARVCEIYCVSIVFLLHSRNAKKRKSRGSMLTTSFRLGDLVAAIWPAKAKFIFMLMAVARRTHFVKGKAGSIGGAMGAGEKRFSWGRGTEGVAGTCFLFAALLIADFASENQNSSRSCSLFASPIAEPGSSASSRILTASYSNPLWKSEEFTACTGDDSPQTGNHASLF